VVGVIDVVVLLVLPVGAFLLGSRRERHRLPEWHWKCAEDGCGLGLWSDDTDALQFLSRIHIYVAHVKVKEQAS
jgi:hypothetical protein